MPAVVMTAELDGVDELKNKLYSLDEAVRVRIMLDNLRVVAEPLLPKMRENINSESGDLAASLDVAYRSYRQGAVAAAYAGPTWPRGAHGQIVDKGTEQRYTREGYYRGISQAYPFIEPAFGDGADLIGELGRGLAEDIEREATR